MQAFKNCVSINKTFIVKFAKSLILFIKQKINRFTTNISKLSKTLIVYLNKKNIY